MKRRVIIVGDGTKDGVRQAVETVAIWLEGRIAELTIDLDDQLDLSEIDADLVLSYGGDGSILHTARRMGAAQKPVLGVNFGKLGFLTDVRPEEIEDVLAKILEAPEIDTSQRLLLRARLEPLRGEPESFIALNDVVITRTEVNRMVVVSLSISGDQVTTYHGDGLIVATPIGSTAHSLSAGGPIVHPEMRAIVLTPICPHTLTNRPIVVSPDEEITMRADGENAGLTIDGQVTRALHPGDQVVISAAPFEFERVRIHDWNYYRVLREKLGWGIEPRQVSKESREDRS